jgi:hypothetical protein
MKRQTSINYEERVQEYFALIQDKIQAFNSHVEGVLTAHEQDFMRAFKAHIYQVQKQMQQYKNFASIEQERKKRDKEINDLTAALDWHKQESQRFDELLTSAKVELASWKAKAQAAQSDNNFLQDQLKTAMRELNMWRERGDKAASTPITKLATPVIKAPREVPARTDQAQAIVGHLQRALSQERRKTRKLNALTSQTLEHRSDLEDIFLDCVTEVRKVVGRRSPQASFLTTTDKKHILELLVSNDKILALVYEHIFPYKKANLSFSAASSEHDSRMSTPSRPGRKLRPHSVVDGKLMLATR